MGIMGKNAESLYICGLPAFVLSSSGLALLVGSNDFDKSIYCFVWLIRRKDDRL